jgi:hypothetical protein
LVWNKNGLVYCSKWLQVPPRGRRKIPAQLLKSKTYGEDLARIMVSEGTKKNLVVHLESFKIFSPIEAQLEEETCVGKPEM